MAPRKSPQKEISKKPKSKSNNVSVESDSPVAVRSPPKKRSSKKNRSSVGGSSKEVRCSRSSRSPIKDGSSKNNDKSVSKKSKKSAKRSLIKNPGFRKDRNVDADDTNDDAPWFSSLVNDVASVLNRDGSPLKRKASSDASAGNSKKRQHNAPVDHDDSVNYSGDDSDFDMGDDDYFYDQFDDVLDDCNATNNANTGGLLKSQKKELLDFMESFISAYDNKRVKSMSDKSDNVEVASRKTLRFTADPGQGPVTSAPANESFRFPVPFGSQHLSSDWPIGADSRDRSFVNSLKQDRQANKVAENFLQLAGLSQSESSDLFRKANAKKSGEHWKPSDSAPVEIRWPQEMLDRPRGLEIGYNELTVAEFLAGNLSIIEAGPPDSKYYALVRAQLGYFRTLCEDISDYNWGLVREAHKAVLLSIEKGNLDPNDLQTMEIKRKSALERAYRHQGPIPINPDNLPGPSPKPTGSSKSPFSSSSSAAPGLLLRICKHYNEGRCSFEKEQQKGAYLWTHICGFCWHRLKQKRSHQENECEAKKRDSNKASKNEKGANQ